MASSQHQLLQDSLVQMGLDQSDLSNLRVLARYSEWTSLLKLFRALDRTATESLIGFSTAEEAYERRGFIKGMRKGVEAVENIYAITHGVTPDGNLSEPRAAGANSSADTGNAIIDAPSNPGDAAPRSWSY